MGQQHFLFRNLPIVGSATVDASAAPATSGNASASGKTSANGKASSSAGKAVTTGKSGGSGKSSASDRTTRSAKSATQNAGVNTGNGVTAAPARGLLRFGRKPAEPEPVSSAPQAKVVRQQPVRQTRSKRSGNSGKR